MIEIVTGDITGLKVDAIVNAANSSLMGGGGVDGAIHRAGGSQILEACKVIRSTTYPDGLPAGEAVITTGGKLPAAKVIHTVGPVWHGGGSGEGEVLANAYKNSLILAEKNGIKSIAFPAISTGVYGYPKELAGRIAHSTVSEYLSNHSLPEKVYFVFFSESDAEAFRSAVSE